MHTPAAACLLGILLLCPEPGLAQQEQVAPTSLPTIVEEHCEYCPPGWQSTASVGGHRCKPCPPGQASSLHGDCEVCLAGMVPNAEKTVCINCPPGRQPSADGASCDRCAAGMFSSLDSDCRECTEPGTVPNREKSICLYCPPGQQPAAAAAAGECIRCPVGRYSNLQSSCGDCPAGSVPTTAQDACADCLQGRQPRANRTASWCQLCMPGMFATAAGSCQDCPAAKVSTADRAACVFCSPGKEPAYRNRSDTAAGSSDQLCHSCEAGRYSTFDGYCNGCEETGHKNSVPNAEQTHCSGCSSGMVPNANRSRCICAPGFYNATFGFVYCFDQSFQEVDLDSTSLLTEELSLTKLERMEQRTCFHCPHCLDCTAGARLAPGFKTSPFSLDAYEGVDRGTPYDKSVFRCPGRGCLKKDPMNQVTVQEEKCMCRGALGPAAASTANGSDQSCRVGHTGTLCGVCMPTYYQGTRQYCVSCRDRLDMNLHWSLIGAWAAVILLVFLCMNCVQRRFRKNIAPRMREFKRKLRRRNLKSRHSIQVKKTPVSFLTKLKIVVGAQQITQSLPSVLNLTFPPNFEKFLQFFSFLTFDLASLINTSCLVQTGMTLRLISITLTPVVLIGMVYTLKQGELQNTSTLRRYMRPVSKRMNSALKFVDGETKEDLKLPLSDRIQNRANQRVFLVLFLLYPRLVQVIFQTFNCRGLDHGQSFHKHDYSLSCNSSEYYSLFIYAVVCGAIGPIGIPVLFHSLLCWNRSELSQSTRHISWGQVLGVARAAKSRDRSRWAWIDEYDVRHVYEPDVQDKLQAAAKAVESAAANPGIRHRGRAQECTCTIGIEDYRIDILKKRQTVVHTGPHAGVRRLKVHRDRWSFRGLDDPESHWESFDAAMNHHVHSAWMRYSRARGSGDGGEEHDIEPAFSSPSRKKSLKAVSLQGWLRDCNPKKGRGKTNAGREKAAPPPGRRGQSAGPAAAAAESEVLHPWVWAELHGTSLELWSVALPAITLGSLVSFEHPAAGAVLDGTVTLVENKDLFTVTTRLGTTRFLREQVLGKTLWMIELPTELEHFHTLVALRPCTKRVSIPAHRASASGEALVSVARVAVAEVLGCSIAHPKRATPFAQTIRVDLPIAATDGQSKLILAVGTARIAAQDSPASVAASWSRALLAWTDSTETCRVSIGCETYTLDFASMLMLKRTGTRDRRVCEQFQRKAVLKEELLRIEFDALDSSGTGQLSEADLHRYAVQQMIGHVDQFTEAEDVFPGSPQNESRDRPPPKDRALSGPPQAEAGGGGGGGGSFGDGFLGGGGGGGGGIGEAFLVSRDALVSAAHKGLAAGERMTIAQLKTLIRTRGALFDRLLLAFDEDNSLHLSVPETRKMGIELRLDPHAAIYLASVVGEPPKHPYKAWWHGDARKFKFLVKDYRPKVYFYEVIGFMKKLLLTGFMVFVEPGSATQCYFAICIGVVFLTISTFYQPYWDTTTNLLKITVEGNLVICLLCGLMLRLQLAQEWLDEGILDAILLLSNLVLVPLPLVVELLSKFWRHLKLFHGLVRETAVAHRRERSGAATHNPMCAEAPDDDDCRVAELLSLTDETVGCGEYCGVLAAMWCRTGGRREALKLTKGSSKAGNGTGKAGDQFLLKEGGYSEGGDFGGPDLDMSGGLDVGF